MSESGSLAASNGGERPVRASARLRRFLRDDPALAERFNAIRSFASGIRPSEYHLTNACNIRCRGCWFFEHGFDKANTENRDLGRLARFVDAERERGVNTALLIGGEPTLFPDRVAVFKERMKHVTISTNGLRRFPRQGFEDLTVAITLFGGGPLDDELRAIKPNGQRFEGLLDTALANYRGDPRAGFVFAITERGREYIEPTVRRIAENGNRVSFNFYSCYGSDDPLRVEEEKRLLDEALRTRQRHPETVASHPYYLEVMITGRSHFGAFGYDVCPSISVDHAAHAQRLRNRNPTLPRFNTWGADLETVQFCCTSGHCESCRDSQAVFSWLMVSPHRFLDSLDGLRTWVEIAESYWGQFYWSPFHPARRGGAGAGRAPARSAVEDAGCLG